jgi:CRISPR-associated protein Cas8b/Csh1 subtype I-B
VERRAAFLGGVLVGQISWHQENERRIGRPLDTRTQADKLTPRVLAQAVQEALDNARVYAAESDYDTNLLYPEVVDRLLDALETEPTEWELEKEELQFMVALGQSFGRRAMPVAFDIREANSTTETEPTTESESEA